MKVVVIGSGGREHALLWKIAQNPAVKKLYAYPGNGGTESLAETLIINEPGTAALAVKLVRLRPDLVVVGPEQPLADGITDRLLRHDIPCFGPSSGAARIEASKVFAKELMRDNSIPTAEFEIFDDLDKLRKYVRQNPRQNGRVVKADGLAAGKGAFVCDRDDEVVNVAGQLLIDGLLGPAGSRLILEERLLGIEASVHYWCDGERFTPLPAARDYKRALDGDQGANTGGMGTYCPATHVTEEIQIEINRTIVAPTLLAMAGAGCPYRGALYVGLMLTDKGPQVIEFNCRFGDPETQVMLPVLADHIVDTMLACASGTLRPESISGKAAGAAVCVVLAANGYPASYEKNIPLATVDDSDEQVTFHAGTRIQGGQLVSSGGRVLNAVGLGDSLESARARAYELAEKLRVPGLRLREDIALQYDSAA